MDSRTPKFNILMPETIMSPDRVSTRVGDLEFFDRLPTDATAAALPDHLTFLRGVQAILTQCRWRLSKLCEWVSRGSVRPPPTK